jgi:hypothetical protein
MSNRLPAGKLRITDTTSSRVAAASQDEAALELGQAEVTITDLIEQER